MRRYKEALQSGALLNCDSGNWEVSPKPKDTWLRQVSAQCSPCALLSHLDSAVSAARCRARESEWGVVVTRRLQRGVPPTSALVQYGHDPSRVFASLLTAAMHFHAGAVRNAPWNRGPRGAVRYRQAHRPPQEGEREDAAWAPRAPANNASGPSLSKKHFEIPRY